MLNSTITYAAAIWFAFFVINHAEITAKLRDALAPLAPSFLKRLLGCALCTGFWTMSAITLYTGYTPLLLTVPVATLFIELTYLRLTSTK